MRSLCGSQNTYFNKKQEHWIPSSVVTRGVDYFLISKGGVFGLNEDLICCRRDLWV